jgi:Protein of unknown function (DUF3301)
MTGLLLFVLFVCAALAWWRLLQGKEAARSAAAMACREHGLLLMDDTVVLDRIELVGKTPSRSYGLRYSFEFAHNGILHKGGSVLISQGEPVRVVITTGSGQLIEEF